MALTKEELDHGAGVVLQENRRFSTSLYSVPSMPIALFRPLDPHGRLRVLSLLLVSLWLLFNLSFFFAISSSPSLKGSSLAVDCTFSWTALADGHCFPFLAFLVRYVFPVNLFEDDTGNRRTALSIKGGAISFYPSPDVSLPLS